MILSAERTISNVRNSIPYVLQEYLKLRRYHKGHFNFIYTSRDASYGRNLPEDIFTGLWEFENILVEEKDFYKELLRRIKQLLNIHKRYKKNEEKNKFLKLNKELFKSIEDSEDILEIKINLINEMLKYIKNNVPRKEIEISTKELMKNKKLHLADVQKNVIEIHLKPLIDMENSYQELEKKYSFILQKACLEGHRKPLIRYIYKKYNMASEGSFGILVAFVLAIIIMSHLVKGSISREIAKEFEKTEKFNDLVYFDVLKELDAIEW